MVKQKNEISSLNTVYHLEINTLLGKMVGILAHKTLLKGRVQGAIVAM